MGRQHHSLRTTTQLLITLQHPRLPAQESCLKVHKIHVPEHVITEIFTMRKYFWILVYIVYIVYINLLLNCCISWSSITKYTKFYTEWNPIYTVIGSFFTGPLSHKYPSYPATSSAQGMGSYSSGGYQPSTQPYNPVQTFDPSSYYR